MIFCLVLFGFVALAFVVQEFVPVVTWAYQARLFLVPVVFFASAVSVPFPVMLAFAFFTGFVWDARHLIILPEAAGYSFLDPMAQQTANPAFGYSIALYGLLGSLMQGIRPLFRRGRWELPVLMTGVATALLLTFEYLWIGFLRGSFSISQATWMNIGTTALLSMMISPLLFFLIHWLSREADYQIRYEGIKLRQPW
ncbi:MAG: hypothetical protein ACR2OZ_00705 [Verrucomicrobiales bacterium]